MSFGVAQWVLHPASSLPDHGCTAAGSILPLLCWREVQRDPLVCFLDFPVLYCGRQQENRLMGAGERNSWKLNAMCPHEFLTALSSYCATNVRDSNINRSAECKPNSKAGRHHLSAPWTTTHSDTWGHTHTHSVNVAALVWVTGSFDSGLTGPGPQQDFLCVCNKVWGGGRRQHDFTVTQLYNNSRLDHT